MKRILRFEWIIVIVSLIMYVVVASSALKVKSFGDLDFHLEAKRIASCIRENISCDEVSLAKAPGPSLFYSVPYLFLSSGSSDAAYWRAAVIWAGVWMTLALVLLYQACVRYYGNKKPAMLCIGFAFLLPLHVYYGLGVMAESLAYIGVIIAISGWTLLAVEPRRGASRVGIGILLLILARPNAGLILPLIFLVSGFLWWRRIGEVVINRALLTMSAIVLMVVVSISAAVRQLPGNSTSHQEDYFLHVAQHGRFQFRDETWDWRFWDDKIRPDSKDYHDQQVSARHLDSLVAVGNKYSVVYWDWIKADMLTHPFVTLKQFIVRTIYGHTLTINSITKNNFHIGPLQGVVGYYLFIGFLNSINWGMILLALYELISRRNSWVNWWPMVALWLAVLAFSAMIYMEQRYLFPIRPVIIFFAAGGMVRALR